MKKSITTCSLTILLLTVFAWSSVSASDILLFGPEKYVRTSGFFNYHKDAFSGAPGEATIRVLNGNDTGENRMKLGLIIVNGQIVFRLKDFIENIHVMERTIPVFAENNVTVLLAGALESYLMVSVFQEVPSPRVSLQIDPQIIPKGESATLTWTSSLGESAYIDQGIGAVPLDGVMPIYPEHTTTYTITVSGPMGTASERATIMVEGDPDPLPRGSFGEQYQDLVPSDATVESYDEKRFSMITGLVEDINGLPLRDVVVSVLEHPEYGTAATDVSGHFSIPVDGGKTFSVAYSKEGLLASQRKIYVPWNDVAVLDTIQMIEEDSAASSITFDGSPEAIVTHQSTEISDAFGSRACSLVFSGDNHAYLMDDQGNDVHELATINVRATEYQTPESMPAKLPPNSAFTYCVELTVDGAKNVRFSKPVPIWVDNFLGFDVGEVIPVGFYNRTRGVWEPSDNGVVVKLLDTNDDSIVDALDADGDDQPDDLNQNGSFTDEVMGLENAERYAPGTTYWRAEASHFTPYDLNLPKGSPTDAVRPNSTGTAKADSQTDEVHSCRRYNASFVEDRSRVFHEDIPVPGTDMMLHYASNRVQGYHTLITVPVSGDTVPASLKRILVTVKVAGHTFTKELAPLPDQVTAFFWDGLDYNGRPMQTPVTAHVSVGFVYNSLYYSPGDFEQAFGQPGTAPTDVPSREEIILWEQTDLLITPPRSKGSIQLAEGWSISPLHHMNLQDYASLHKGDGTLINTNVRVISMIYLQGAYYSHFPDSVATDAAGNIYVAESFRGVVYKIDPEGNRTRFAGEFNLWGTSGDGGPAVDAQLYRPSGVAVDRSGNVYVTDLFRIRKVDTEGIITTIAGTGVQGTSGDGGPAADAQLYQPRGIAVDDDGNIYFAEVGAHCIRKIAPNGIITTVAGTGSSGFSGDGGPALNAQLSNPSDVACDSSGNLYIADSYNNRIRMIDTSGMIATISGSGSIGYWGGSFSGDGGPAVEARMRNPQSVAVDSSGNIYVSDTGNLRIRLINNKGLITTIAGSGTYGWDRSTHPAIQAKFKDISGIAVDAAGNIFVADTDNNAIRKISNPSVFKDIIQAGDNVFSEENGTGHIISIDGRHTKTIDLDSGITRYTYHYDDTGKVISITDQMGNAAEISRDSNGSPSAIISPDGVTTTLSIDSNNHLTQITYPDGQCFEFKYTPDGLMTVKVEPNGNRFEHHFDDLGRLTNASDQAGGSWTYAKTVNSRGDELISIATAEGNITSYEDYIDSTGAYSSVITDPTGAETLFYRSADGLSSHKNLSCGMDLSFAYDLDTVYLHPFLKQITEATPSGLTRITTRDKIYQDTNYDGVADLITQTTSVNGRTASSQNNILLSQETWTSPAGRVVTTSHDPETLLLTSLEIPERYETQYTYDAKGRMTARRTHLREDSFTYNTEGFLESVVDGAGRSTVYAYDEVGRIARIDRPDNSSIRYTYDENGNMTLLTNPAAINHGFDYNAVNLGTSYHTPVSGNYGYTYDGDRRLTRIFFPSGKEINHYYDATRLMQIRTPKGNIDFTYLCGTTVGTVRYGFESIAYGYDGSLLSSETNSGTLNQEIYYDYNHDFDMVEMAYAGDIENYAYDSDGLLTGAGRFTIARNADNGQAERVTDGNFHTARIFSGYGEVDEEMTTLNEGELYSWRLVRDNTGRVLQKTEIIAGISADHHYTYDAMGRLLTVTQDGFLTEAYQYDSSGTRSDEMNALRNIAEKHYEYSLEDHLLTAGTASYQYDPDGFLTHKTDGEDVVAYEYASRGELLTVMLPNGTVIEYLHDPLGRRIAKKVNGQLTEKYLWQNLTRLLAVYDGADNLLMRFEYADSRVPAAMVKNGVMYYLVYDPVGSLRVIADTGGHAVKRIDYDAYGNVISESNPSFATPFGFAGGLYDSDTGLIRFGHRDYDPDIGRWTAKDPIFFNGGDVDLYGYCLNDPLNLVDPSGLEVLIPEFLENLFIEKTFRYSHTNLKGSILFTDYSTQIHDKKDGLFSSPQTKIGVSTSIIGGGVQFVFDTADNTKPDQLGDISVSFGVGRYLGMSVYPKSGQISLNIGLGFSPPISISTQLDTIDHSCN
jgi:RHS repeat-associated protein